MKKLISIFFTIILSNTIYSQSGSITNVNVAQRTDGTGMVDTYFDLDGSESAYYISLEVSFDGGITYAPIDPAYVTGDIGPFSPGPNKHVIWNGIQNSPDTYSAQTKIKIIAGIVPTGYITDIDGNIYQTVTIGEQTWTTENLKVTHYRNGSAIEYPGSNGTEWLNNTSGAYAWYNNDIIHKNLYGALYNWYTVNNPNELCPIGWHVPSNAEWTTLIAYAGGESVAGGKLKSTRTVPDPHPSWNLPNTSATDEFGFAGIPGGMRYVYHLDYGDLCYHGVYWSNSSSDIEPNKAWYINLTWINSIVYKNTDLKYLGFSIRCIMD
ncbi:MAG: fibrobacter succinogenes major paralogous domain-containing protein [Bacteroidales bacterium]|nr:fibrobacter succinogenes major paralogous domain-containing protein [Bacteroidales bacterium]